MAVEEIKRCKKLGVTAVWMRPTMDWFEGRNMACTSDYPHWDSSGVSGVVRSLKNYPDISEETRINFFSRAAIEALGLRP